MNSIMLAMVLLVLVVLLLLISPLSKRERDHADFDEKNAVIKVYRGEATYIHQQQVKGFIDEAEKTHLLAELDKQSALAFLAIDKKPFAYQAYRSSWLLWIVIVLGLTGVTLWYANGYRQSGAMHWQAFNEDFHGEIIEGLFDQRVVAQFVTEKASKMTSMYCFAMQGELLAKYDRNPDALANLANCYLHTGYPQLAQQAIERGLKHQAKHIELNYLVAEWQYGKEGSLSQNNVNRLTNLIQLSPGHFRSIRLLALDNLNQGNFLQAKKYFEQLKQLAPDNDKQLLSALDGLLDEIEKSRQLLGASPQKAGPVMVHPSIPNHPPIGQQSRQDRQLPTILDDSANLDGKSSSAGTPNAGNLKPTKTLTTGKEKILSVSVSLSPDFNQQLTTDSTLFIIVKTPQGKLLNASKYTFNKQNQPLTIDINDEVQDMMLMEPMSGYETFSVVARISLSHSPIAKIGDLTSPAQLITLPQKGPASLVIDQIYK